MKNNPLNDLRCIHCNRLPYLDDIFIAKVNDEYVVEVTTCLHCADMDTRPEKTGGWITCKRTLSGWKVMDIDGNFTNDLEYYD